MTLAEYLSFLGYTETELNETLIRYENNMPMPELVNKHVNEYLKLVCSHSLLIVRNKSGFFDIIDFYDGQVVSGGYSDFRHAQQVQFMYHYFNGNWTCD